MQVGQTDPVVRTNARRVPDIGIAALAPDTRGKAAITPVPVRLRRSFVF
jgi:hypothetical protein